MQKFLRPLILSLSTMILFSVVGEAQDSLAEAARKNRPKGAQVTPKRVWTNDDVRSANETKGTTPEITPESAPETLQKFRLLGKEDLGAAVLKMSGVNVDFLNRKDWEQRLFESKQTWLLQVDRMTAHKDAAKDVRDEELRLALGAQRNFERISGEGAQQARAVNDPVLRAHLDYQRQQDFCKQTSGDLLFRCEAGLDELKLKMQREGIW
jgi:hypothetical protein